MSSGSSRLPPKNIGISTNTFLSHWCGRISFSMLFFIYCAFEGWHPEMWLDIISMGILIDLASLFNPLPMGTGTAELSFTALVAVLFSSSGAVVWALLIWRFLTNYIYLLQGFFLLSYDYAIGNRRLEKNKEFWLHPISERIRIKREKKQKNKSSSNKQSNV